MLSGMFTVSEAEVAAIRAVYEQRGELAAAVEVRRHFPGIFSSAQARECARIIAGWKPLPLRSVSGCRNRRGYGGCADHVRLPSLAQSGQRCSWPSAGAAKK